jgi:hypothetical protein
MLLNQILLQFEDVEITEDKLSSIRFALIETMKDQGIDVEYLFYDKDAF